MRACTPPLHVCAARTNLIRNDQARGRIAAAGPVIAPPFKGTDPSRCIARDLVLHCVLRARIRFLDYRAATAFFLLAGAAAAPFGAGQGFWTP
jgi:hypothetical protein